MQVELVSGASEDHDFGIERRPSALEKVARGAKLILSGVADTFALAKRDKRARPVFLVGICGSTPYCFGEDPIYPLLQEILGDRYTLRLRHDLCAYSLLSAAEHPGCPVEKKPSHFDLARALIEEERFDLILVYLNPHGPVPAKADPDPYRLVADLKSKCKKPIVILTDGGKYGMESAVRFRQAGADAYSSLISQRTPSEGEAFIADLRTCVAKSLKTRQPGGELAELVSKMGMRKGRPPRIIVVNDDPAYLKSCEIIIRGWFKEVTLLLFGSSSEAWQELSQTDPDLLVIDVAVAGLKCKELVLRLLDRKVAYPIVVMSACKPEEPWVQQCAKGGLNVRLLRTPFELGFLCRALSYVEAVSWVRTAAEQGDAEASIQLFSIYLAAGSFIPRNEQEAIFWLRKAAEQGSAHAAVVLGLCYQHAVFSVPQDYEQAVHWFREAAERGLADAQCSLGLCYEKGHGVPQDYEQAVHWFHKAAGPAKGNGWVREIGAAGQYHLGRCYAQGHGVPRDPSAAYRCFKLAAEAGHPEAQEALTALCRSLSPDTLALPKRPPRIVILDDEPMVREMHSMFLKCWYTDAEVRQSGNPEEVWNELSEADPDLFITDINHPGMSCKEMLSRLAERKVQFPILVISGFHSESERRSWEPNLKVLFLEKPYSVENFRSTVETALGVPAKPTPSAILQSK